jgi:hypothetical protein
VYPSSAPTIAPQQALTNSKICNTAQNCATNSKYEKAYATSRPKNSNKRERLHIKPDRKTCEAQGDGVQAAGTG